MEVKLMRVCPKCKATFPTERRDCYCKPCRRRYMREYKQEHKQAQGPEDDLYVFRNPRLPGEFKVGRSSDVERRRLELQASQNFHLEAVAVFPGMGRHEAYVHDALAEYRVLCPSREWFRLDLARLLAYLGEVLEGGS